MNPAIARLHRELIAAFEAAGAPCTPEECAPRACTDARFGDYQCNAAMAAAKRIGLKSPALAATVVARWQEGVGAQLAEVSIAGPGFINLRLCDQTLSEAVLVRAADDRPAPPEKPQTVLLDFSSPNVAKSMHVGHIRSTILGDCLARVMRYLGHQVITDNHIGDWGTQFGKLIAGYRHLGRPADMETDPIGAMERLYKWAHERGQNEPSFEEQARAELKKLQSGDPENLRLWEEFRLLSQSAFDSIYNRLNIRFDHTLGESFYNEQLNPVIEELLAKGIARESEGAVAIFSEGNLPPKEDPFLATNSDPATRQERPWIDAPFLIRKTDGAALYATTDLATLAYRANTFAADQIWYVTDLRQSLHFRQLFEAARRWGVKASLSHIGFGAILGQDNRPLKTREGDPVKLEALLDEAVTRAHTLLDERRPDLDADFKDGLAEVLGIGAVKYADLAQNRHLDYLFDWNKMLAFDGNTAPYVLNAYVRAMSIFRKADEAIEAPRRILGPSHPRERALMILLTQWEEIVHLVASEHRPHHLCFYLFSLASAFHSFFEECHVLRAEETLREHRLALVRATAQTIRKGCELLGIPVVDQM